MEQKSNLLFYKKLQKLCLVLTWLANTRGNTGSNPISLIMYIFVFFLCVCWSMCVSVHVHMWALVSFLIHQVDICLQLITVQLILSMNYLESCICILSIFKKSLMVFQLLFSQSPTSPTFLALLMWINSSILHRITRNDNN